MVVIDMPGNTEAFAPAGVSLGVLVMRGVRKLSLFMMASSTPAENGLANQKKIHGGYR
jgi:hypothetical protein